MVFSRLSAAINRSRSPSPSLGPEQSSQRQPPIIAPSLGRDTALNVNLQNVLQSGSVRQLLSISERPTRRAASEPAHESLTTRNFLSTRDLWTRASPPPLLDPRVPADADASPSTSSRSGAERGASSPSDYPTPTSIPAPVPASLAHLLSAEPLWTEPSVRADSVEEPREDSMDLDDSEVKLESQDADESGVEIEVGLSAIKEEEDEIEDAEALPPSPTQLFVDHTSPRRARQPSFAEVDASASPDVEIQLPTAPDSAELEPLSSFAASDSPTVVPHTQQSQQSAASTLTAYPTLQSTATFITHPSLAQTETMTSTGPPAAHPIQTTPPRGGYPMLRHTGTGPQVVPVPPDTAELLDFGTNLTSGAAVDPSPSYEPTLTLNSFFPEAHPATSGLSSPPPPPATRGPTRASLMKRKRANDDDGEKDKDAGDEEHHVDTPGAGPSTAPRGRRAAQHQVPRARPSKVPRIREPAIAANAPALTSTPGAGPSRPTTRRSARLAAPKAKEPTPEPEAERSPEPEAKDTKGKGKKKASSSKSNGKKGGRR